MPEMRKFKCYDCNHEWEIPYSTGRPEQCSQCKSRNIHRAEQDRGYVRVGGFGYGKGRWRLSI